MKRKLKNTINIGLIVICICAIVGVTVYAKNNLKPAKNLNISNSDMMGTPPDMNNNSISDSNDADEVTNNEVNSKENNNTNQPPEKPSGDNTTSDSSDRQAPPEKPSNDNNSNSENSNGSSNMQTPPDIPNKNNDENSSNMMGGMLQENNTNVELTTNYVIIYSVLSFLLAGAIIYLVISKFNKKTFKESFSNSEKIVIYGLTLIIVTSAFSYSTVLTVNNKILNDSSKAGTNIKNNNISNNLAAYSSVKEITENTTIKDEKYTSTTSDENAILATGDIDVKLNDITITKTGDSNGGDNASFYGINSSILAKSGANITIKNATIKTNATGANGVFNYGGSATTNNSSSDNTTINISNSTITTTKDNSGGIMTTGGGITNATNLTVNTSGTSSAAIRSDRGGGVVTVSKGTYTTTGKGSPAIYSTAEIKVSDAELISKASEGIVIEGKNSVSIDNCKLTDSNTELNGQSTTYKNIFLYQSMSGDADSGNAEFTAKNSTITTNNGDTFYVTNTSATITLENNTIINNDKTGNFLRIQKDSWGNSGSNGGNVTLILTNQKVTGNIAVDSISTLNMSLKSKSTYKGVINSSNEAKNIKLELSEDSRIKLTGDSYIASLEDEDTSYSNIDFNGYKLYVNGKAIN